VLIQLNGLHVDLVCVQSEATPLNDDESSKQTIEVVGKHSTGLYRHRQTDGQACMLRALLC